MRSLPAGDAKIARPEAEPLTTSSAFHVPPACAAASRAAEAAASPSEAAKSLGNAAVQSRLGGRGDQDRLVDELRIRRPELGDRVTGRPNRQDCHPRHVAAVKPADRGPQGIGVGGVECHDGHAIGCEGGGLRGPGAHLLAGPMQQDEPVRAVAPYDRGPRARER